MHQKLITRVVRSHGSLAIAAALLIGGLVTFLAAGAPAAAQAGDVSTAVSCLGGGGRVDTNIHNGGAAAGFYRIEFGNLTARAITVEADDWGRISITGRPPGDHRLVVTRDGAEVVDRTVTVDCAADTPPVSTPEVQILNTCRAGNGYFLFQFVNPAASPAGYVIATESVNNRSTTAAPFGAAVRAVTGRYDGEFEVSVRRNGVEFFTTTLVVNCDGARPTPTPTPPASGLVWGKDTTAPSSERSRPALYTTMTDPVYGTDVTRVTSAEGTRFNRNTYSRRQAENADGTRFMTYHGDAQYRVYDRSTGGLVRALGISPDAWPQWHPTNPDLIRYTADANSFGGDLRLYEVNVESGASVTLADLTSRIQASLTGAVYMHDRAEGSPSADGDIWSWLVYNDDEDIIGIVNYDLSSDQVLGVLPASGFSSSQPLDWVSASPSGDYVIAGHWDGAWVYDADLTNPRLVFAGGEHSDIAIGANGNDSYVYIDFTAGSEGGWLVSVDLVTLMHTLIFDLYDNANTSIHISGKGYNKPGWVVVSTYNCKVPGAWSCHKVMAVELAANGRILNLAHTYNCGDDYWTETHAVVNRAFTRVYFNTDHGSCGIDAEVMLIDVPGFE